MRALRSSMNTCAWLCALLALSAAGVRAESLDSVVQDVVAKHPTVRSSAALLDAAAERVRQAKSNYYPSVGMQAMANKAHDSQLGSRLDRSTRNADAFLRWNLFRGLADYHSVRMAKSDRDAADEDLADAHERVALQVAAAYLDVLRLRRRLEVAANYVSETAKLMDDVGKLVAAGKAAPADIEQIKVGHIEAQWQVGQLRGELAGAEQGYRLLVGTPPGELRDPRNEDAMATLSQDDVLEQVLATNPKVRAAQARVAARGEEVGVAGGALMPRVDLELRKRVYSDIKPDPVVESRDSAQVSLNYEMPLGGGNFSAKREAAARMAAAQADLDEARLEAETNSSQLWNVWSEARNISDSLGSRAAASDKVVAAYDQQFNAGRRSLQDLIAIRDEHQRTQADVIDNLHARQLGAMQILALLGRLRESLNAHP
ncbi:MAG: TolC family protein [Proteobacteria bacterium]|nr:TolC family protein [Pseudomonadota bacterium]